MQKEPEAEQSTTLSELELSEKLWKQGDASQSLDALKKYITLAMEKAKQTTDETIRSRMKTHIKLLIDKFKQRKEEWQAREGKGKLEESAKKPSRPQKECQKKPMPGLPEFVSTQPSNEKLSDLSFAQNVKNSLLECIVLPLKFPQLFSGLRRPFKGILLFGAPGVGKTLLAKSIPNEMENMSLFYFSACELASKYCGESERMVRNIFNHAKQHTPCIICIDDIEGIFGSRFDEGSSQRPRRIKTQFLIQMQETGRSDGLVVIGITNRPWELCPAVRRRFEKRIYVNLPDLEQRKDILRKILSAQPNLISDSKIPQIASRTEGFVPSDLSTISRDAIFSPLRDLQKSTRFRKTEGKFRVAADTDNSPEVIVSNLMKISPAQLQIPLATSQHLEKSLRNYKQSVNDRDVKMYDEWNEQFGSQS